MLIPDETCGRKVTMHESAKQGRNVYLWNVLVDGKPIPSIYAGDVKGSRGRVLKMGNRYIPILDGYNLLPWTYSGEGARKRCAEYVALVAKNQGLLK